MSIPYELAGRTHQKQRTRQALVAAAREMVAQGVTPTVEASAAKASISRTTAYRYFPNQRTLLLSAHPEIEARSLLPENPPKDPEARLDVVIRAFLRLIVDTELQQRTMLSLTRAFAASCRCGRAGRSGGSPKLLPPSATGCRRPN